MSVKSPVPLTVFASDVRIGMARTLAAMDPLGIMPGVESLYLAEVDRLMQELDGAGTPDRFADVIRVRYPDLTSRQVKRLWAEWRPVAFRKAWEPLFYSRGEARRFVVALLVWLLSVIAGAVGMVLAVFWSVWLGMGVVFLLIPLAWPAMWTIRRIARRDPYYRKVHKFYKHRIKEDYRVLDEALLAAGWSPRLKWVVKALGNAQPLAGVVTTVAGIAIPWAG